MRPNPARRAAALGVAVAASAACALTGVTPAAAATAPAEPVITVHTPLPVAVPTTSSVAFQQAVQPSLDLTTTASSLNAQATLTIDARKVAKIATVTFSDNCTVHDYVASCSEMFFESGLTPTMGLGTVTQMSLGPRKGVKPGASATYTVSGTADTAKITGATGTVQAGGAAFDETQPANHTGLKVGSTVSEPIRFTNLGDRPATATEVGLVLSPGLEFAQRYSNCHYSAASGQVFEAALCTFPGTFRVGETAELADQVKLKVESTAYYTYLDTVVAPQGDPSQSWLTGGRTWKQGTGKALGLKVITAGHTTSAPPSTVQLAEAGSHGDYRITSLQAVNTADFAVTGASAKAAQGSTVKLSFSMVDHGPATIYDRSGEGFGVKVTPPPGTTIVGSSAACQPYTEGDPTVTAHGPYECGTDYLVPAGHVWNFSLTLRVDQVITGAKGSVAMDWSPQAGWRPPFDPNPKDDSAVLALN
ncbi:hypothetical protein K7472_18925 [Streptomyces sp. PTM05]|uniref:Uncharacterized protein n=1 Tax=Streptantibioticus parmotrematis TaxID=2873249 RepID=A0ABS7QUN1_9ACTN|nr:hypothetical protein [Streptantibioticus parmotrematis]MBY8886915.1 hypothetical protein [Streptantibioticus parmotrematis]